MHTYAVGFEWYSLRSSFIASSRSAASCASVRLGPCALPLLNDAALTGPLGDGGTTGLDGGTGLGDGGTGDESSPLLDERKRICVLSFAAHTKRRGKSPRDTEESITRSRSP